jgi:hypothetical protein
VLLAARVEASLRAEREALMDLRVRPLGGLQARRSAPLEHAVAPLRYAMIRV